MYLLFQMRELLKWHILLAGKCTYAEQTHQILLFFFVLFFYCDICCIPLKSVYFLFSFMALPFAWLLLWVLPLPHVNAKRMLRVYSFYIRVFFCIIWRRRRKTGLQPWQINPPHAKNATFKGLYSLFHNNIWLITLPTYLKPCRFSFSSKLIWSEKDQIWVILHSRWSDIIPFLLTINWGSLLTHF